MESADSMGAVTTEDLVSFRGYPVKCRSWSVAGRRLSIVQPADSDSLLDSPAVHARFEQDEYMPYWADLWPAAFMLADAVLAGENGRGRRSIELGCGLGLGSLAAAMQGWSVTASDYDEDAIAFATLNAQRNRLPLASSRYLDYREPPGGETYDLILGADLLYEKRLHGPVAQWIAGGLADGGCAWLTDPGRSVADAFPDCARAAGLRIKTRPVQTRSPDDRLHQGRLWCIQR